MGAEESQNPFDDEDLSPSTSANAAAVKPKAKPEPLQTQLQEDIDFGAAIASPATRRKSVKPPSPEPPNLAFMDDDEAFDTVCNEIDQAMTGHYSFLLSDQPKGKHPTVHQLEKLLEEQGFQHPDLRNPEQREVIKNIILNKRNARRRKRTQSTGDTRTPPSSNRPTEEQTPGHSRIITIAGNESTTPSAEWDRPARKRSLSKLAVNPSRMPPMPSVDVQYGGRWMRPQSLVDEEKELNKKYNVRSDVDRVKRDEELEQKRLGFDLGKFSAANTPDTSTKKDLEIFTSTTYQQYDKRKREKKIENDKPPTRPKLTSKDVAQEYNASEESLLAAIEKDFV